jgi:hypothetical protein
MGELGESLLAEQAGGDETLNPTGSTPSQRGGVARRSLYDLDPARPPTSAAEESDGGALEAYGASLGALLCDALCFHKHPAISKATGVEDYPGEAWLPGARPTRLLPVWWLSFQQWAGFNPFSGLIDNYILPLQVHCRACPPPLPGRRCRARAVDRAWRAPEAHRRPC